MDYYPGLQFAALFSFYKVVLQFTLIKIFHPNLELLVVACCWNIGGTFRNHAFVLLLRGWCQCICILIGWCGLQKSNADARRIICDFGQNSKIVGFLFFYRADISLIRDGSTFSLLLVVLWYCYGLYSLPIVKNLKVHTKNMFERFVLICWF